MLPTSFFYPWIWTCAILGMSIEDAYISFLRHWATVGLPWIEDEVIVIAKC